jgi:hypothetical protein
MMVCGSRVAPTSTFAAFPRSEVAGHGHRRTVFPEMRVPISFFVA